MKKTEKLLFNDLYSQALEALSAASDACISDSEDNDTVPLLVLDAAYRIACYSRATRVAGCQKDYEEQKLRIKAFLKDIVKNMSGNGCARLSETCSKFFDQTRIREAAVPLQQVVQDSIATGTLDELKSQEQFKQAVFDLFLVFDRFYCLSHSVDCPLKELKSMLSPIKEGIVELFRQFRGLFTLLREEFSAYASTMRIPQEKHYALWYSFPAVTVESFISSLHNTLADMQKQRDLVAMLLQELPPRLRERFEKLPLKKRFSELIDKLSTYVHEVKNYCQLLVTPVTVVESPAVYGKRAQKATSPYSLAQAMYSDALSKLPTLIQNSPKLPAREKRELLLVTYLLLDDREKLKKYLPARKRTA